mgnify:CR=1 FL=1
MTRELLVDADSFTYTIGSRVMIPVELDDGNVHAVFNRADIKADLSTVLEDMFKELGTRKAKFFLSDPNPTACWRKRIYPGYKHKRVPGHRPVAYQAVREEIAARFEVFQEPNMEADDLVGMFATKPGKKKDEERVVVSPDKDLLTVPGFVYNPTKKTLDYMTENQADMNLMMQTLTGDSTDNYPGLPGCGPKTAARILDGCFTLKEAWPKVLAAYTKAGMSEDDAVKQAQMAGILRHGQYNFATKVVTPWSPPK